MMNDIVEFDALKTKVLKYILYKKRTEQEVKQKFSNVDETLLEDVIEYLKEAGYINDGEYIQRAVNEFMNLRTLSLKEISYKLYAKGLSRDTIEKYMSEQKENLFDYEKEAARKIAIKKSSNMVLDDIIVFLKKKGYREDSIKYGTEDI